MSLSGYKRSSGKRSGGICSLALISAEDVAGAQYDPLTGTYTGVTLRENAGFFTYEFREGSASYQEVSSMTTGTLRITHELRFSLERPDQYSVRAASDIMSLSKKGLVAIITTNSGVSFLVGYRERFGTEQALRYEKGDSDSGLKAANDALETITLVSEDNCKAFPLTGEISK